MTTRFDRAREVVMAKMADLVVDALEVRGGDGLVLGHVAPTVREGLEAAAGEVAALGVDRRWLEAVLELEAADLMAEAFERGLAVHAERRRIRATGGSP